MKYLLPLLLLGLVSCNNAATTSTIEGVQTFAYEGGAHQEGRVDYKEALPVGGNHNPGWQNCREYSQPLYNEYAVHSLEHGAVWITYQPGLPAPQLDALRQAATGRTHMLLSPRAEQPAPIVLTAWNAQLELQQADDARLKTFIQKYEQGGTAPEIGASCSNAYSGTQ